MSETPLTPGDPLGGGTPTPPAEPPAARPAYGGPVPPGAFQPPAQPTAAPGPYVLASWWSRVGASILDSLILAVGALIVLAIFGGVFSVGFLASDEAGTASVIVGLIIGFLAFAIAALLYAPLLMARTNGQTLGKMVTGIRVVRTNGERMDFAWAALREVAVKWLGIGMVAGGVTFGLASLVDSLWPLWDSENRALHDFAAQTRVVKA